MSVNNGYVPDNYSNGFGNGVGSNGVGSNGGESNGVSNHHLSNFQAVDSKTPRDQEENLDDPERKQRDRDPLLLCKWIVSRPGLSFGLALCGHLLFILLFVILMIAKVDVMPLSMDNLPLDVRTNTDYLRSLAWIERNEETAIIDRTDARNGAIVSERTEGASGAMIIYYESKAGNVFTQENLKVMQDIEEQLYTEKLYQKSFCHIEPDGKCALIGSVLRYFDGSKAHIDKIFDDKKFENIVEVIYTAFTNNRTKRQFEEYLGADAIIEKDKAKSKYTRFTMYFGAPLKGYKNATDEEDEQHDKIGDYIFDYINNRLDKYYRNGAGEMNLYYFGSFSFGRIITSLIMRDLLLAVAGLFFVFIIMCIQTRSLWITTWAVFSILASFFTAILVYRLIFDFRYVGIFHVLSIFIILGIGADDVFVFFDTWKHSSKYTFKSLAHRLSYTYRRASIAMLFTSLTTATAFIVSAASPFLAVNSFGVFSGVLILVNYMSVIVFLPTVIISYHLWFHKFSCCCCCTRDVESQQMNKPNIVVRFFQGPYFKFITSIVGRIIVLVLCLGVLITFIAFATKVKLNEEETQFLKKNSNIGKFFYLSGRAFKTDFFLTQVYLIWGLKEQDLSKCHKTDVSCNGDTVWDEKFNLNAAETQEQLLNFCNKLRNLSSDKIDELAIKRNIIDGTPEISCFAEEMSNFYLNYTDVSYPVEKSEANWLMTDKPEVYQKDMEDTYDRPFEIAMSYWLYNGFDFSDYFSQFSDYKELLGVAPYKSYTKEVKLNNGAEYKYGTQLRYMAIAINTTIDADEGYVKVKPIRDAWEDFAIKEMAKLPEPLQNGYQTTYFAWNSIKVQEVLVQNAVIGVVVGVCVAFPILVVATHNIITGVLATLIIIMITTCVVGLIPMAGWKLGILESLNLVLVVGLSVDYVVHLAEGYSRSLKDDRSGRTRDMLQQVGISVLSGAITTMGASVAMLFSQIIFFYQFGLFVFCTILFSIFFALVLFTTVMGLIGPQNEVGSLKPLYKKITQSICRK